MSSTEWSEHFKFLPQGAKIQSFIVGDHNIVLGFEDPDGYNNDFNRFFGETIGRVGNRISGARIENLNDKSYTLHANNGSHSLHGGREGWGKKTFDGPQQVQRDGRLALHFTYLSPDGDEGYPGTVKLDVWYYPSVTKATIGKHQVVTLEIEYEAQLVGDEVEETAINVTNHSYFNISGASTIEGTSATLSTNLHQETDNESIPTGVIKPFPGIEKNEAFTLGSEEPDVDHCFIFNDKPKTVQLDTRSQQLEKLCEFRHSNTGIHLEALSTEPAFQFYTGKYIDVPAVYGQPARGARSGMCIEAQRYVNAINVDDYRSMVVLRRGQTYGSRTVYRATIS
ncbi:hypothetical protein AMS68_006429 [Peltaster fructicola]|uniref:Aldose 1-epimerase n=1 Tax=Peltaster fructicola TaxID=286661 RepID=A0A6H0Y1K0_9PEZI|nr:hypothetical protein AMS68_006429 [Peltaster fructicola]